MTGQRVKVTVKKSSLNQDAQYTFGIGKLEWIVSMQSDYLITNMNYMADYEFTSSDPDTVDIKSDGTILECKKIGEVDVTVKETYNKTTRTLGKVKVTVAAPSMDTSKKIEVYTDKKFDLYWYIYYAYKHEFEITETDASGNSASKLLERYYYKGNPTWNGFYHILATEGTVYIIVFDKTANLDLGTITLNIVSSDSESK